MDLKKILVTSDTHHPFHDEKAVRAHLKFAKDYKPDVWMLNGDIMDMYSLSRFVKDNISLDLEQELESTVEFIRECRDIAPKAKFFYIEGNHELRLKKYIMANAPHLRCKALQLPNLLGLEKLKIDYVHTGTLHYRDFMFSHGERIRAYGGYTAKANVDRFRTNVVCGHVHRIGESHFTDGLGRRVEGHEFGCLCKPNQEYVSKIQRMGVKMKIGDANAAINWQQGFGVVESIKVGRKYYHTVYKPAITDGKFVFNGQLWKG